MSYQSYLDEELAQAKRQNSLYAAERKSGLDAYLQALERAQQAGDDEARRVYRQNVADTNASYREELDKNAVSERIARRNIAETMANMGLTDSGLHRTEQTALSTTRARTDNQTERQRLAAVDKLTANLQTYLSGSRATLDEQKAKQTKSYQEAVASNLDSLLRKAQSNATSRYNADQKAYQAELKQDDKQVTGTVYVDPLKYVNDTSKLQGKLSSAAYAKEITEQLLGGDITPQYLAAQLSSALSNRYVTVDAVCRFIRNLNIVDVRKRYLARNASSEVYRAYMDGEGTP